MLPPPPDLPKLLGDEADAERGAEAHLAGIAERLLGYFEEVAPLILHVVTHPAFDPRTLARAHDRSCTRGWGRRWRRGSRPWGGAAWPPRTDPRAAAEARWWRRCTAWAMFHVHSGAHAGPADRERVRSMVRVFWRGLQPR